MNDPEFISIFNDVLGPVMRGPSSSHTAGSYHIARVSRSLLGEEPDSATLTFDPDGSYAATFSRQSADKAFAAGLMGWDLTDERFGRSLALAAEQGLSLRFKVAALDGADHPNSVKIDLSGRQGGTLHLLAKSTGGGGFLIQQLEAWPVAIDGKSFETLLLMDRHDTAGIERILDASRGTARLSEGLLQEAVLLCLRGSEPMTKSERLALERESGAKKIWSTSPVFYPQIGQPLFDSAATMVRFAEDANLSLGQAALEYEARLLGLGTKDVMKEMLSRFGIMAAAAEQGLHDENVKMKILRPSAGRVLDAEKAGRLAVGGLHTRAAARALAALHISNSGGVVCAAPTGGSSGVIPGVMVTLAEDRALDSDRVGLALLAAGAIGLIIARRATFAAEVAGCQVEIGAAGAMAAAAVVEASGGTARQAANAAAISLQNSMGSVCDLVQGLCEIPCHTRNAVAASSAFVCADLMMGGYMNPVPLDETIDAVFASGRMLPPELLCTAQGGLAVTPSALALKPRA